MSDPKTIKVNENNDLKIRRELGLEDESPITEGGDGDGSGEIEYFTE